MAYPEMSGSSGFLQVTSTATLTATRNLIAPLTKGFQFAVQNATSGGQSIQVIGSSGTGVTILNGTTVTVSSDGAKYVQAGVNSLPAAPSFAVQLANSGATALAADPNILINTNLHSISAPILNGQTSSLIATEAMYSTIDPVPQIFMNNSVNGFGYNLGNNGTSTQGWTGGRQMRTNSVISQPGITQIMGGFTNKVATGDFALGYWYHRDFGGQQESSGEGIDGFAIDIGQGGYITGTVTGGSGFNSSQINLGSLACNGTNYNGYGPCFNSPLLFSPLGIMFDTQVAGATLNIPSFVSGSPDGVSTMGYNTTGGSLAQSTAWGSLISSSCTSVAAWSYPTTYDQYQWVGGGDGHLYVSNAGGNTSHEPTLPGSTYWTPWPYQNVALQTCNVNLGSGSGSFVVSGTHIFLSGPFQDESVVTAVGSVSGGVQQISFLSRFAWDGEEDGGGAAVMQGGVGGQGFIATGTLNTWPIAYQAIGAVSNRLYFSNPFGGPANNGGDMIFPSQPSVIHTSGSTGTLTRASNIVTLNNLGDGEQAYITSFPVGSTIVISGAADTSFNGTFTIATNSKNYIPNSAAVLTWSQTGSNATTSTFVGGQAPKQITLYPMSFITGTNNGVAGVVQLATNSITIANGDSVVSTPASEIEIQGSKIDVGVTSPTQFSSGFDVTDSGLSSLNHVLGIHNPGSYVPSSTFIDNVGIDMSLKYATGIFLAWRPANNGAVIYNGGGDPVAGAVGIPYYLYVDAGSGIRVNPGTAGIDITNNFSVGGSSNLGIPYNSLTTVGGRFLNVGCTQGGCPSRIGAVFNSGTVYDPNGEVRLQSSGNLPTLAFEDYSNSLLGSIGINGAGHISINSAARGDALGTLDVGHINCSSCSFGSISGTTGKIPLFTGSTVVGNSHLDDGLTTSGAITSSEQFKVVTSTNSATIPVDIRTSGFTAGTLLHLAANTTDVGGYFASGGDNNFNLSAGCAYNGSWIQKSIANGFIQAISAIEAGDSVFFRCSGTVGSVTTLTQSGRIRGNGNLSWGLTDGFVVDSSGNAKATTLSSTGDGSHPSQVSLVQNGVAPTVVAGSSSIAAATTVTTANTLVLPAAPCTGYLRATNTSGIMPITCGPGGGLTVGTTTITSGTSGNIEYNNAGVLGEKGVSGTGSVALTASPTFTGTPTVAGDLKFTGTAPTVSSCGGGTIATGSTDNSLSITGVGTSSTTNVCTISFRSALQQGFCVANFGNSGGPQDIWTKTASTTAVIFQLQGSVSTGTIYAHCF